MTLWYYASTRVCGIVKNHDFGFYRTTCNACRRIRLRPVL